MYKTTNGLYPPDDNIIVWRYIDFTKFVDLLNSQTIYFTRADKFEDPYEGLYPVKDVIDKEFKNYDVVRKQTYVSCWSMGENESAALWKIYSDSKNSIAIQSTFGQLKASIEKCEHDVYASVVRYKDYNKTDYFGIVNENIWAPAHRGATVFPIIYKRVSFAFENELRLIYVKAPVRIDINESSLELGKRIKIDLEQLIYKLHLSPYSDEWFRNLVLGLLDKYNLGHKEVIKSDLFTGLK
jgi:hypothetical protein